MRKKKNNVTIGEISCERISLFSCAKELCRAPLPRIMIYDTALHLIPQVTVSGYYKERSTGKRSDLRINKSNGNDD